MIKKYLDENRRLILFILLLSMVKQMLMIGLPIFAYSTAGYDDRLLMNFTDSILKGEWIGSYSQLSLIKGTFFSVFMAFNNLLGIPYCISMTTLYSLACAFFILGVQGLFRSNKPLYILFFFLLFNPISFADETFFRVYRSSLTASLVLIVVGAMFALYLKRFENQWSLFMWAIIAGVGLASLWNNREDSIWIIPLVVMIIVITWISFIIKKSLPIKEKITRCFLVTIPIGLLVLSTLLISSINYNYYGVFTTNELSSGSFANVMKQIYSIQADEEIEKVSVPRSTIEKLYIVSPTLNQIKIKLDSSMDSWSWYEDDEEVRQVEDGWFVWSLREAVASAGYYKSAQMSDEFYKKVSNEIELGIKSGELKTRPTMPSTMMSPWRQEYWYELPQAFIVAIHYIAGFEMIETTVLESIDDGSVGIRTFEKLTNNLARYPGENVKWSDQVRVDFLNSITRIYQTFGVITFLIAILNYMILTILMLKKKWRDNYRVLDCWLVLSALLGSVSVLALGIAYTDSSAYVAISYWYLAGAYPLMVVFTIISMFKVYEIGNNRLLVNYKKVAK